MKLLLIVIAGILAFMVLTGVLLPLLISTNELPIMLILLLLATLAFAIGAVVSIFLPKFTPPKDEKNDSGI